jgi:uncharacterized membrane protein YbhN (UPF0104 family)
MKLRSLLVGAASAAIGVALIIVLVRAGHIDVRATLGQLRYVNRMLLAKLVLLTGFHILLSDLRWRTIDSVLRSPSDSSPSMLASFTVTSLGVVLGQILPVQVSMTTARTLGTHFYGRAAKRGALGTLFEQSFDVLIACLLLVASGATRYCRGGAMMWSVSAAIMSLAGLMAAGPVVGMVQRLAASSAATEAVAKSRILRSLFELRHSGLLDASLARRLVMLSIIRFAVLILMVGQTAKAVEAQIPLWHLAASMPFVIASCVLAITPGGLGVGELSYAAALGLFGTPLAVSAPWSLANRVLVTASCVVVAAFALTMHGFFSAVRKARSVVPATPLPDSVTTPGE